MKVLSDINSLQQEIARQKKAGRTIGFVPTMGALHSGHLSLLMHARKNADYTVVSIFVNPKQFNDPEDLRRYPRTPEKDQALLLNAGCDLLFMPSVKEVFPTEFNLDYKLGYLDQIMEGKHRRGHFRGVVTVVHRLFTIVEPDLAFFGEKDCQQLVIIRKMSKDLGLPVRIIPCPIVREPDGLAMSSRNQLLTPEQRAHAPLISKTLHEALHLKDSMSVEELRKWVISKINNDPCLELEYFELADANDLKPVTLWTHKSPIIGCIAVWAGKVRLIDNLKFSL